MSSLAGMLARRYEARPRMSPFTETGTTGLNASGGKIREEFVRNLQGTRGYKTFQEMRENCAVIGSVFFAAENFIVESGFDVKPANDSPNALQQAEFVNQCFDDMEHSRSEFLAEVVSTTWFGFGLHQKVFKRRSGNHPLKMFRSKYNDGRIGIRKLPIRAQNTIEEWVFGKHGDPLEAIQQAPPDYQVIRHDLEDLIHFRTTPAKNNPQGRSWLRNAYRSWWFLKRIQEYEAVGVSKDMAGVPVGRIPLSFFNAAEGTDAASSFANTKKVLERMQRGEQEYVLWPAGVDQTGNTGWDIGLMQAGGRRPMDVDGIIRRYESRILVSMLAEAVLLGQQGNVGSWSLASTQTHMFAVALGGFQRMVADALNRQLIPDLALVNGWPQENAPKVVMADLESEDMVAKLGAVGQALQTGVMVPGDELDAHFREKMDLPLRENQQQISPGQFQDALGAYQERANAEDAQMIEPKADAPRETRYMRIRDLAERWDTSPGTIRAMVNRGTLRGFRVGSQMRIGESEIARLETMDQDGDGKPDDVAEQDLQG